MGVDREDVQRIAGLAGLDLTELELDGLLDQLGPVLDHVAALEPLGADGLAEGRDPGAAPRPDVPGPDPLMRRPADFAPAFVECFFVVDRLQAFDPAADPEPTEL